MVPGAPGWVGPAFGRMHELEAPVFSNIPPCKASRCCVRRCLHICSSLVRLQFACCVTRPC